MRRSPPPLFPSEGRGCRRRPAGIFTFPAGAAALLSALALFPLTASPSGGVAVSIAPLADIVRQVAGEEVRVVTLWPEGEDPRSAPPSAKALEEARGSLLVVTVGAGLEGGARQVLDPSRWGGAPFLELSGESPLIGLSKGEKAEGKIFSAALGLDGGGPRGNPFLWLDPVLVKGFVRRLLPALGEALPEGRRAFSARADRLLERLEELDRRIGERLASGRGGRIAVFTGAAAYFCRRYGLEAVPVTGVTPGGGPGRTSLTGTVALVKRLGVEAVITDPLFPRKAAETAATRAGVSLLVLEPFGAPGRGGYFEIMEHTVDLIEKGLTPR